MTQEVVSPQEFDEVKARYQAALACIATCRARVRCRPRRRLAQAHTALSYTRVLVHLLMEWSPKGKPTTRHVWPVRAYRSSPSRDLGHYRLEATVNENDLRHVRIGEQVSVVVDALENADLKRKGRTDRSSSGPRQPQFPW